MEYNTENKLFKVPFEGNLCDIDTIKEASKGLVAFCVRNNTILEDYHAMQVPITDERMKQLMIDCVNNVYFILAGLCSNDLNIFKNTINILCNQSKMYAYEWNEPELPEWVDELKELYDRQDGRHNGI